MAGKKKTTFTKLARERKLRERRLDKQAKKEARKRGEIEPASEQLGYAGEQLGYPSEGLEHGSEGPASGDPAIHAPR